MDSAVLLKRILIKFKDLGRVQVTGYKSFGYIKETEKAVYVSREAGEDTPIPFSKLLMGIEAYKSNPQLYHEGPTALRAFKITHVTSPIYALLHLLEENDFK